MSLHLSDEKNNKWWDLFTKACIKRYWKLGPDIFQSYLQNFLISFCCHICLQSNCICVDRQNHNTNVSPVLLNNVTMMWPRCGLGHITRPYTFRHKGNKTEYDDGKYLITEEGNVELLVTCSIVAEFFKVCEFLCKCLNNRNSIPFVVMHINKYGYDISNEINICYNK